MASKLSGWTTPGDPQGQGDTLSRGARRGREGGFTIVELVVVIVVAGILAAVVAPRFDGRHGFEERGFRDQTVSALRYAQKTAIALRRPVCANFVAAQVNFTVGAAFGQANCVPGGGLRGPQGVTPYVLNAPQGVTYAGFPAQIVFAPLGSTNAQVAMQVVGPGQPAGLGITVEQVTGYVR